MKTTLTLNLPKEELEPQAQKENEPLEQQIKGLGAKLYPDTKATSHLVRQKSGNFTVTAG